MARMRILKSTLLASIACVLAGAALAQGAPREEGPPRGGPPPEAIAACSGKAADAACSFTGRQGEKLNGKCFSPPPRPGASAAGPANKRPLACKPAGMPQR